MRLYLDDNLIDHRLVQRLRRSGHDVQSPVDVGMRGEADPVHLTHAIRENRVLLTSDHDDFEDLHDLLMQATGHHPGIVAVRSDNDPRRDMTHRGIVAALSKLEAAGFELSDAFVVLNQWR